MSDAPMSLRHPETPKAEDTALAQESHSHVAGNATLQLIAELVSKLRGSRFSWWTPELLRGAWDATARMGWFGQRPDIRQRITCNLTGLRPKAARGKLPDYQAALIDSVIDDGDMTVVQFENEFDAIELAAYAPVAEIWHRFRERMPWDQDMAANQELVAWLIDRLLASSSTIQGMTRKPILTPHAIRTTIPGRIWHSGIPLEVRVAIDELRLQREQEKPGEPFHAVHELGVATPTVIASSIRLRDLLCVFDAAERAMGLPPSHGATAPVTRMAELPAAATPPRVAELPTAAPPAKFAELPTAAPSVKIAEAVKAETPKVEVKASPAAEVTKIERPQVEVKAPPAVPAPPLPLKVAEAAKAEPTRTEVKAPPAPSPVEQAPEKMAEKAAAEKVSERAMDRWERMATKVLERVGKEKENSGSEETRGKDR